ncbi:PREDICTED: rab proteins geranylgeranyltransferase component A 1-like [Prunus mume]|uniref:Rab proteins geranylgeranyltransferase component A 1-like n=1 Tax=Prunus mume TaxID=102107 RepID=A0ABM1LK89_PRUMU|nr:PREDICTED: rab proteins geranylgeranyltransferase component A 1-like [Prunus mume]XP_008222489.1 PREDICTED: rab proteins geranylgeranyltransferase component A 1-like [Prunus mume]XP_016647813.1 PREDICTED: rab proteins geranylgeranyltransferase component A 1-like [Prunus mume]XP_016647814.1 PREDICTED: rab proteins geranylgeranyltransferase component A 1-like [Prunus mume]XP_016647815.1 PREDICTED: rab proteins geranylgeranyltransferase component A 1-like [Prunus mume]XP_016647816.1 PREDICTED:
MSGFFCPGGPIKPTTFDLIVIGTGIPGSVIAAAASAVGKTVLHLDPNPFYGSHFASLPPNDLTSFLNSHSTDHITTATINTTSIDSSLDHDYIAIDLKPRLLYSNIETAAYAPEILAKHCPREFTIDLGGPRLLFPADKATDLLMKSGLNLYVECGFLEFKNISEIFVCDESGQLRNIPHSRIEMFKDRSLSLKEKSMLARFFKFLEQYLEASRGIGGDQEGSHNSESSKISEEDLESPFIDFINRMQLPPKIKLIIHCIAMVDCGQDDLEVCKSKLKTRDGLERLALYHSSRSSNAHGAWIYPEHGHGDLSAAFARRAAVKGCITALHTPVNAVLMDKDSGQYKGVRLASGQALFSHHLVLDPTFTVTLAPTSSPPNLLREGLQVLSLKDDKGKVARGICITASSLKPDVSNCVLVCPPRSLCPEQDTSIWIIQICGSLETGVCPKGMFLLYFSALCDDAEQGKRLLQAVKNALLTLPMSGNPERASTVQSEKAEAKPTLLWSTLYIQELTIDQHEYLISTPMPDGNLWYNDLLDATVLLFQKLYPNEEFFPETPGNLEDDILINLED